MTEASDRARRRLGRLRCLLTSLRAIQKEEAVSTVLCFVPKTQKLKYTGSEPLSVFSSPSKDSSKLGEICGPKEAVIDFTGLPVVRKDVTWVRLADPSTEKWLLVHEPDQGKGGTQDLVSVSMGKEGENVWRDAIDRSFGTDLLQREPTRDDPDEEWVGRLSAPPPGWKLAADMELIQFLLAHEEKNLMGGTSKTGNHISSIEVSSESSQKGHLIDGMNETYWESNGETGQHWIKLSMKPGVVLEGIALLVDREDESYLPRVVVVKTVDQRGTRQEVIRKTFHEEDYVSGEVQLLSAPLSTYYPKVEVYIKSCMSGGIDTRIHGIATSACGTRSIFITEDIVAQDIFDEEKLSRYPNLQSHRMELLARRSVVLKRLAALLEENLLFLLPQWEYSCYVRDCLAVIKQLLPLCPLRQGIISEALQATSTRQSGGYPSVHINRFIAAEHRENPSKDSTAKNTVFSQIYHGLLPKIQKGKFNLRAAGHMTQWWECKFAKEHVIDQGGGFRDSLVNLSEELCPPSSEAPVPLPFFLRSSNQDHDSSNIYRDVFVPNPGCHDYAQYRFIGVLMGGAYRSSESLVLSLPRMFWKQVVGEPVTWTEDFSSVDRAEVRFIESLENMSQEAFDAAFAGTLTFTTVLSGGKVVPLVPGGEKRMVRFEEREEFCRRVRECRMEESKKQTDAILEGLTSVVPREVLVLHTWTEMEEKVCGNPEVSVQALKKHAIYDSDTSATDARVQTMWSALERFTNEERSQFLRFITGRRRLPCSVFVQTMRQSNCLPRAATCSNALYLPEYSSVDMAYKKLLYAAYNCMAIDTDG